MVIKNYDEVAQQITDLLVDWAKECADYERSIYLYYDEETQLGEIDYHIGSGWLDDDHYTIYSHVGEPCSVWDTFEYCDAKYFADILGLTLSQLMLETNMYLDESDGDPDIYAIQDYIESREDYMNLIWSEHKYLIEEDIQFYEERAYDILDTFLREQNYEQ